MFCFRAVILVHLMCFSPRQGAEGGGPKTRAVQVLCETLELLELWVEHRVFGSLWRSFVT